MFPLLALLLMPFHEIDAQANGQLLENVTGNELQQVIDTYRGEKAVLINVWATWCAPCVEEFPEIVRLQHNYPENLQVIFVSGDFDESRGKALAFLKEHKVDWTTYFKVGDDQEFIETISDEWSGALPFTKVISINGEVINSWEGSADYEKFERNIKIAINP